MVTRDLRGAPPRDCYRVLSGLVVPRPIAWVATANADGTVNLAPFSSFMGLFNPPGAVLNLGRRPGGALKDTHRNLRERGEAVIHIPDAPLLEAMHATGADAPEGVSEAGRLGLATAPSTAVKVPRLAEAPVALECRLRQEVELSPTSTLILLDVLVAHAADRIWDEGADAPDASRWEPVARLRGGPGPGPNYALLGQRLTLGTPELP